MARGSSMVVSRRMRPPATADSTTSRHRDSNSASLSNVFSAWTHPSGERVVSVDAGGLGCGLEVEGIDGYDGGRHGQHDVLHSPARGEERWRPTPFGACPSHPADRS